PPCRRWCRVPARPGPPGCGPMPATTGRSAAAVRRWWPIGSRTAAAATARRVTWQDSPARCRSTAIPQSPSSSSAGRPNSGASPARGKLADAIRSARRRRDDLERFLDDGRIEIDTNIVERAIRPQVHHPQERSPGPTAAAAPGTIATLQTTAKLNGVDPDALLKITLECIADGWPNRHIDALMPWNHQDRA